MVAPSLAQPGVESQIVRGCSVDQLDQWLALPTIYVASSAALSRPTFLAAWIVPAGMNSTSPALRVTGGLPSTWYSKVPSRT